MLTSLQQSRLNFGGICEGRKFSVEIYKSAEYNPTKHMTTVFFKKKGGEVVKLWGKGRVCCIYFTALSYAGSVVEG